VSQRLLSTILFLAALGTSAAAAELTIDGVSHAYARPGQSIVVSISGMPGAPVILLADVAPGPLQLGNKTLGVGGSAGLALVSLGAMPALGQLDLSVTPDGNPDLADLSIYLTAVVGAGQDMQLSDAILTFVERSVPLAGEPLSAFPFFQYVSAFNMTEALDVAVDPGRYPQVVGQAGDIYVVESKTGAEWNADPSLTDVSGDGVNTVTFGGALLDNIVEVDGGSLSGSAGDGMGHPYDVVVDLNQDGLLDAGDLIDGFSKQAGLYVVHDIVNRGPHVVVETLYSGGSWLNQDLYYPADIAAMTKRPLVIVSHGNGHNYQWYDHIGMHLASYGFIVMSHSNNTGPGIQSASTTTLTNTDYLLGNLHTIAGGALLGKVDQDNIAWIGHSRGGEGVAKAYDRLVDEGYPALHFVPEDIVLISSIAPTDFLGPNQSDPHDKPYHLWVGGADADVTGCASSNIAASFHLLARAEQRRLGISLHGVGHGDFHDGGGSSVASGPCKLGRNDTHAVMRGYLLPLVMHHQRGNIPAEDFLWRQYESFHPLGAPIADPCLVVDLQLREGEADGRFVIEDYQDGAGDVGSSSSGQSVTSSVTALVEGLLDDENSNFTHNASQPFNGMTYCRASDSERGAVFEWDNAPASITWEVAPAARNARIWDELSLRACQATRHPLTTGELADLHFDVTLTDHMGQSATVSIETLGGGVEEPYQRSSCGTGVGWGNEFETISVSLDAFEADGSGFDLGNLASIRLSFGPGAGSLFGRLGLDDLQLVQR